LIKVFCPTEKNPFVVIESLSIWIDSHIVLKPSDFHASVIQ